LRAEWRHLDNPGVRLLEQVLAHLANQP
jgi:hypothetical protein